MTITRRVWLAALAGVLPALGSRPAVAEAPVLIFAAASLRNALDEAVAAWARETGAAVSVSYAASSALARQIEAGAPADLFLSADQAWMDHLAGAGLIAPGSRSDLLRNRLVLIAPKDATTTASLGPGLDLGAALAGGRLAMADVAAVPAGRYGRAALEHLGAWEGVKERIVQAENVRAALRLVALGEAPLGIVYATDAVSDPQVRVVAAFPPSSHPPIVYPVARLVGSTHPRAAALLGYLRGPAAGVHFERQGFALVASERRS